MDNSIAYLIEASLENFLQIYLFILVIRILLTWFQTMGWAQQGITLLSPLTDPYLNIFRSFIPPMGGMDFSPIVALLALQFLGYAVIGLLSQALFQFI